MKNRKVKILLIEDNADDAALIKRKLEKASNARFQVTVARKLRDGLKQAEETTPDLILSDLGLPDSHGLDTVTKILLQVPHIPLVVLSGFDDEDVAIKAVQSGAQDYLVKGYIKDSQLERSLFYSIERARLQAELEQHTQEILNIQANLHKILEKNADAIVVVGEDRRILFANPAVETILGRRRQELINQQFEFPLGGEGTSEIEIKGPAKETTTAEMSMVKIQWEGAPAYLASIHNISDRKKMEEILRASEEKYRNLVELAQYGIIAVDTKGVIISCNQTFVDMLGSTTEEIIGKHFTELPGATAKDLIPQVDIFASVMKGEKNRPIEILWNLPDGTPRICELMTSLMKSGEKIIGIQTIVIDITERKKVEESLRVSEEKYSKAFRNSPQVIMFSKMEDSTIIETNDTFLRLTGYTRGEIIGVKSIELGFWAFPEERRKIIDTLKKNGIVTNKEVKFRMKSGEIRTWLFSAEIIDIDNKPCMLSVNTDITERKQAEEKLRQSEEFSSSLMKSSAVPILVVNADTSIKYVNPAFEKLTGFTAEEIIGVKAPYPWWREDVQSGSANELKRDIHTGVRRLEKLFWKKNGERFWVEITSSPVKHDGEFQYSLENWLVITERKQAEEALKQSEEKYRELITTSKDGIISVDSQMKILL